jgi:hypothetical protein
MAHALADFFAVPAQAAPARRSLGRRVLDAITAHQMARVEREIRAHAHLFETPLIQGDLRRVGLIDSGNLPFNR